LKNAGNLPGFGQVKAAEHLRYIPAVTLLDNSQKKTLGISICDLIAFLSRLMAKPLKWATFKGLFHDSSNKYEQPGLSGSTFRPAARNKR